MTHRELRDWWTFETRHQPLPDRMTDTHGAMICSIVVGLAGGGGDVPTRPVDFMLSQDVKAPAEQLSPSEEIDRMRAAWRGGA
jgi:hypothetical protein